MSEKSRGKFRKKGASSTKCREGTAFATGYLRDTIELCKERGIEVLLTELPYPATKKAREYANGVAAIAEEYNISFINFLESDKIGTINLHTDMKDTSSHVNDSGARKVTAYLGKFIDENYDIPDRREDPAYVSWFSDYAEYTQYKYSRIRNQKRLDTALMLLADKNVDSCVYIRKGSKLLEDKRLRGLVSNIAQNGNALTGLPEDGNSEYFAFFGNREGSCTEAAGCADLSLSVLSVPVGAEETASPADHTGLTYQSDGNGQLMIRSGSVSISQNEMGESDICLMFFCEDGTVGDVQYYTLSDEEDILAGYRTED